jgi:transcriptional regulator with XRE-family HTH domain
MIHNFFDQTLKRYGITGKRLSEVTGYSTTHISEFRNGKTNPSCETLMCLLSGMDQIEPGARQYFCALLAGKPIETTIERMDGQQIAQVLVAIADKLQSSPEPVAVKELLSA